jgi:hypothetical protein
MKEYTITVYETFTHTTTVEAEDSDSAVAAAYEYLSTGNKENVDTEAIGFTGEYEVEEWD